MLLRKVDEEEDTPYGRGGISRKLKVMNALGAIYFCFDVFSASVSNV